MPSAFAVLARDHEAVKRMFTDLELGPTAAAGADRFGETTVWPSLRDVLSSAQSGHLGQRPGHELKRRPGRT